MSICNPLGYDRPVGYHNRADETYFRSGNPREESGAAPIARLNRKYPVKYRIHLTLLTRQVLWRHLINGRKETDVHVRLSEQMADSGIAGIEDKLNSSLSFECSRTGE